MDRKIKFRGKRIDNNEWVYGYLCFIYIDSDKARIYSPELVGSYDVLLESVGQYIGIEDKNNKEIYEGDVTRTYGGEYCQGYYEYDDKCIVKWQTCGFDMVVIKEGYGIGLGFCDNSEYIEILGNKTDNPKLLEN
jgi:uncharacterized phage protein (TIGR01671 family)